MPDADKATLEAEKALADIQEQDIVLAEVQDLESIDLGLESVDLTIVAARERYNAAVGAYTLGLRLSAVKGSVAANRIMHNEKAAAQFDQAVKDIDAERQHALRLIRDIDRKNHDAKARMLAMVKRARDKPEVCPKCGFEWKG